jgi:hypothetical protein
VFSFRIYKDKKLSESFTCCFLILMPPPPDGVGKQVAGGLNLDYSFINRTKNDDFFPFSFAPAGLYRHAAAPACQPDPGKSVAWHACLVKAGQ